ncbi:hypothetical protein D3C73_1428180 [compost metagenome]
MTISSCARPGLLRLSGGSDSSIRKPASRFPSDLGTYFQPTGSGPDKMEGSKDSEESEPKVSPLLGL